MLRLATILLSGSICFTIVAAQFRNRNEECLCFKSVASGLSNPVFATIFKGRSDLMFVGEQVTGKVWLYHLPEWRRFAYPFLDIGDRIAVSNPPNQDERGLVAMAFDPDFVQNKRFYIYYTVEKNFQTWERLSRFKATSLDSRMNVDNAKDEVIVWEIPKVRNSRWHHGGGLLFNTDGYLYQMIGDGGSIGDPFDQAQNTSTFYGAAIRINVNVPDNHPVPYTVPADNPFVNTPGYAPELWAYGLRNPWQCSVDRGHTTADPNRGRLYCGDVGQSDVEEVDEILKGKNYGWSAKEGSKCFKDDQCENMVGDELPISSYTHAEGAAVIGGYVYRGCENPHLRGEYLFADFLRDPIGPYFVMQLEFLKHKAARRLTATCDLNLHKK